MNVIRNKNEQTREHIVYEHRCNLTKIKTVKSIIDTLANVEKH